MNPKVKIIFIISVSVIFVAVLLNLRPLILSIASHRNNNFYVSRDINITEIRIKDLASQADVKLTIDDKFRWRLNQKSFANQKAVDQLISILGRLAIRHPVSLDYADNVNSTLDSAGRLVTVYARDYRIRLFTLHALPFQMAVRTFLIGHETPDGRGTYMRLSGAEYPFVVHIPGVDSELSPFFDPGFNKWLDPIIVDLSRDDIRSVTLNFADQPGESYTLLQNPDYSFVFKQPSSHRSIDNLPLDSVRVFLFLSSFKGIRYERLVEKNLDNLDKTKFDTPFVDLRINSEEGTEYRIRGYRRKPGADPLLVGNMPDFDPNSFYILINDGQFAVARYYDFNRILRPLSFFVLHNQ